MKNQIILLLLCATLFSCSKYLTPGSSVDISELADPKIAEILSNKPAAVFPVNLAIAHIQAPNYRLNSIAPPSSQYSLILSRNHAEDEAMSQLSELSGIKRASAFNKLLLPLEYKSIKDLRVAAAKMKAGVLLVYTYDTEFWVDTKHYGPQNLITLGSLKNKQVQVVTTASAAIYDVQTEFLYGLAEGTAKELKKSNVWRQQNDVDQVRRATEERAFYQMVEEIKELWPLIMQEYQSSTSSR